MAMPVEVVRSRRRRKTVEAEVVAGTIRVHVPAWMSTADTDRYVAELVGRLERRTGGAATDLTDRARRLARRYDLPRARSVTWSDRQRSLWGSCSVHTRDIRVSARLQPYPTWVLDYVLVHELAHLVHADHSPAFTALVDRYPKAERARGFLIAKGWDADEDPAPPEVPDAPPGQGDAEPGRVGERTVTAGTRRDRDQGTAQGTLFDRA